VTSEYVSATAILAGILALTLAALFCVDSQWRTAGAALTLAIVARGLRSVAERLRRKGY